MLLAGPPNSACIAPATRHLKRENTKQTASTLTFSAPYQRAASAEDKLPMPFEATFTLCGGGHCFIRHHKSQALVPRGEFPAPKPEKKAKKARSEKAKP